MLLEDMYMCGKTIQSSRGMIKLFSNYFLESQQWIEIREKQADSFILYFILYRLYIFSMPTIM